MKRAILLTTLFLFAALSACAQQQPDPEADFTFIIVTGYDGFAGITKYVGSNTDVRIPERIQNQPVTYIDDGAFAYKELTSVTIPTSVTHIHELAFAYNQLTSVIIPTSVTTISGSAFLRNQLTSVSIPDSVTHIDVGAFTNNPLTNVSVPRSASVDPRAFPPTATVTYR